MPARRAQILLFLIETRTAALVAQSRRAVERFLTEQAENERNLAFFEAFALGREPPLRPTVQNLEQYAARWADLVPENAGLRAAIAHLLGHKYELPQQSVSHIRAMLGLDTDPVRRAYQRQYGRPLESIYAPRMRLFDRLRWAWAGLARKLDALPPFWTAFALTLTETVGAGILALPIALAAVGPLAGIVVLVVLGVVNQLTIAALAESMGRSGAVRYGNAFFGRLVADYLGGAASLVVSVSLALTCFLALIAFYIGTGTILADTTHVPAVVWVALLFALGVYVLSRGSLNSTIASALVIGAVNIGIIVIISLLTLTHLKWANVAYVNVPLVGGRPFDASILRLIFGVVLAAYFGHMSVGSCARVVLERDPSGRSLSQGSIAAQLAAMAVYCLWVFAVNGAIAPQALAGLSGTALTPLVAEVGLSVQVLGSLFAILAMGLASIHMSLGLVNMTREWLPARSRTVLLLARRQGSLNFAPRATPADSVRLNVTYLGLENGQPRLRLDTRVDGASRHIEFAVDRNWELTAVMDRVPELRDRGLRLRLDVLAATAGSVRLGIASSMNVTQEGGWDLLGLRMADALRLPDAEQQLVNWLTRHGEADLAAVTAHAGQDQGSVRARLTSLVEHGYVGQVDVGGETRYRVRHARRRASTLPDDIWQGLQEHGGLPPRIPARQSAGTHGLAQRIRELVVGDRSRLLVSFAPVCLVFMLSEWLLLEGAQSFAAPLSFAGVIAVTLVAGIFPVLMLVAARRRAELVPGLVLRFLGHPLVTGGLYCLFVANLFLHGLIIWSGAIERISVMAVGLLALGVTIAAVRRGSFTPRAVVELRDDRRDQHRAVFLVTVKGELAPVRVRLSYADREQTYDTAVGDVPEVSALQQAVFKLPPSQARELKVWVHQITREGESERVPGIVEISSGEQSPRQFDLGVLGDQVLVRVSGGSTVQIKLAEASAVS
jgi:amino acid permease